MQKVITNMVDDITGKEYEDGETVTIIIGGVAAEVDLATANKALGIIKQAHEAGRKVKANVVSIKQAKSYKVAKPKDPVQRGRNAQVRAFAKLHGCPVPNVRGRIPTGYVQAFTDNDPTLLPGYKAPEAPKAKAPARSANRVNLAMSEGGSRTRVRAVKGKVPTFSAQERAVNG